MPHFCKTTVTCEVQKGYVAQENLWKLCERIINSIERSDDENVVRRCHEAADKVDGLAQCLFSRCLSVDPVNAYGVLIEEIKAAFSNEDPNIRQAAAKLFRDEHDISWAFHRIGNDDGQWRVHCYNACIEVLKLTEGRSKLNSILRVLYEFIEDNYSEDYFSDEAWSVILGWFHHEDIDENAFLRLVFEAFMPWANQQEKSVPTRNLEMLVHQLFTTGESRATGMADNFLELIFKKAMLSSEPISDELFQKFINFIFNPHKRASRSFSRVVGCLVSLDKAGLLNGYSLIAGQEDKMFEAIVDEGPGEVKSLLSLSFIKISTIPVKVFDYALGSFFDGGTRKSWTAESLLEALHLNELCQDRTVPDERIQSIVEGLLSSDKESVKVAKKRLTVLVAAGFIKAGSFPMEDFIAGLPQTLDKVIFLKEQNLWTEGEVGQAVLQRYCESDVSLFDLTTVLVALKANGLWPQDTGLPQVVIDKLLAALHSQNNPSQKDVPSYLQSLSDAQLLTSEEITEYFIPAITELFDIERVSFSQKLTKLLTFFAEKNLLGETIPEALKQKIFQACTVGLAENLNTCTYNLELISALAQCDLVNAKEVPFFIFDTIGKAMSAQQNKDCSKHYSGSKAFLSLYSAGLVVPSDKARTLGDIFLESIKQHQFNFARQYLAAKVLDAVIRDKLYYNIEEILYTEGKITQAFIEIFEKIITFSSNEETLIASTLLWDLTKAGFVKDVTLLPSILLFYLPEKSDSTEEEALVIQAILSLVKRQTNLYEEYKQKILARIAGLPQEHQLLANEIRERLNSPAASSGD